MGMEEVVKGGGHMGGMVITRSHNEVVMERAGWW